jgi:hypothetical protein
MKTYTYADIFPTRNLPIPEVRVETVDGRLYRTFIFNIRPGAGRSVAINTGDAGFLYIINACIFTLPYDGDNNVQEVVFPRMMTQDTLDELVELVYQSLRDHEQ